MHSDEVKAAVALWIEKMVIGLGLCPFAQREWITGGVVLEVSSAQDTEQLLHALDALLQRMTDDRQIATALLIHPAVLQDFFDYNQFLDIADSLLVERELEGVFQIASFHPAYQFADTDLDDPENYSNRAPYPLLHILREDDLSAAIDSYPDVDAIPARNVARLNQLGAVQLRALWQSTRSD